MEERGLIIHTDGGARGNPGPGACAFVIENGGKTIFKSSRFLGKTTNNVAEYQGVISALDWLSENDGNLAEKDATFFLDSELIVRQLNGVYKVKDPKLQDLFFQIKSLITKTKIRVTFKNIPREKNKVADFLVNKSLDTNT